MTSNDRRFVIFVAVVIVLLASVDVKAPINLLSDAVKAFGVFLFGTLASIWFPVKKENEDE